MKLTTMTAGLLAIALAGCSSTGTFAKSTKAPTDAVKQFSAPGYRIGFDYPGTLTATDDVTQTKGTGGAAAGTHALALDRKNMIIVEKYPITGYITQANLLAARP